MTANKKTVLITGASQGIGRATASYLAKQAQLEITDFILVARSTEKLASLKEEVKAANPKAIIHSYTVDVAKEDEINHFLEDAIAKVGSINFVINNAGYVDPRSIEETTLENFEHTLRVNLIAPFLIVRKLLLMRVYPEKIINIASTAGLSARPGWIAYASSKAALVNMTETMSEELKDFGIKVIAIAPGRCATELRKILAPDEDYSKIMQPQDVAELISYLLGRIGNFVDKQVIVVRK